MSERSLILFLMVACLFVVVLLVAQCGTISAESLIRMVDCQAQVVCWTRALSPDSLSCLPIDQTKLEVGELCP